MIAGAGGKRAGAEDDGGQRGGGESEHVGPRLGQAVAGVGGLVEGCRGYIPVHTLSIQNRTLDPSIL